MHLDELERLPMLEACLWPCALALALSTLKPVLTNAFTSEYFEGVLGRLSLKSAARGLVHAGIAFGI